MVLHHPTLGPLLGISVPSTKTTQYRNLQYATIKSRFSDPILFTPPSPPPTKEYNATKFGPSCPQHPACFKYDLSLVGESPELEREMQRRVNEEGAGAQDELRCANLIVVVPGGVETDELLPVMGAWVMFSSNGIDQVEYLTIGSGGFSGGSNSWPQYDLSKFVQTSKEIGKPVIAVSINYRLGPFGFLASSEVGASGNYGLKDQACAFQWIKSHISGFGGSPNSLTAIGESAGSICLTTHLHTQPSTPLFNRLIAISGDPTLRRPNTMTKQTSAAFNMRFKFFQDISIKSLTGGNNSERLFRNLPAEELVMKLPPFGAWAPTIDGSYIKDEITIEQIATEGWPTGKPGWCEKVLIGDALGDATVLHDRLLHLPSKTLISRLWKCLEATFPRDETPDWSELTTRIFRAYNLPVNDDEEARKGRKVVYGGMLGLMSDLRFHMPSVAMQRGWGEKVDRYVWGVPNPHPNSKFSSYPSHELEIAYLFQNFPFQTPTPPEISKQLASAFLNFAYDKPSSRAFQRLEAVKAHFEPSPQNKNEPEILYISPSQGVTRIPTHTWDAVYNHGREELWNLIPTGKWHMLGDLMQNSGY